MTVVPAVPLVSVAVYVRYCCDSGACSAPGVLGVYHSYFVTLTSSINHIDDIIIIKFCCTS